MRCKSLGSGAAALIKSEGFNLEHCFSSFARSLTTGGALKDVLKDKIPEQQVVLGKQKLALEFDVIIQCFSTHEGSPTLKCL